MGSREGGLDFTCVAGRYSLPADDGWEDHAREELIQEVEGRGADFGCAGHMSARYLYDC